MRGWIWGLAAGCAVLAMAAVSWLPASAQTPGGIPSDRLPSESGWIALSSDGAEGRQQVTLIDPRTRVMAVYHIEHATGAIGLKSVRQLNWDFQLEDFNGDRPTPQELRTMLQRR